MQQIRVLIGDRTWQALFLVRTAGKLVQILQDQKTKGDDIRQKVMTSGICSNQKAVFVGGLSQNHEYLLKTLL